MGVGRREEEQDGDLGGEREILPRKGTTQKKKERVLRITRRHHSDKGME